MRRGPTGRGRGKKRKRAVPSRRRDVDLLREVLAREQRNVSSLEEFRPLCRHILHNTDRRIFRAPETGGRGYFLVDPHLGPIVVADRFQEAINEFGPQGVSVPRPPSPRRRRDSPSSSPRRVAPGGPHSLAPTAALEAARKVDKTCCAWHRERETRGSVCCVPVGRGASMDSDKAMVKVNEAHQLRQQQHQERHARPPVPMSTPSAAHVCRHQPTADKASPRRALASPRRGASRGGHTAAGRAAAEWVDVQAPKRRVDGDPVSAGGGVVTPVRRKHRRRKSCIC
ncbi:unnamed protein product [Vitrella brassicaformis CCMP3155]|uniref:Uncharacterized protein n=1 Tax=Vitrella brassicaformis (strain CCMP3155) TaxID=1169540 RepID=A0A0G4EMB9_VITBC|nr:unnamed protein product [Vitrella brassicaformis CCMP3155]|eukprot:CEL98018.1 unnamed protein product [Vitrella brassicaformis CCMP3155]